MTDERRKPPAKTTVAELLEEARSRLRRLTAQEAFEAVQAGALLIDIRADSQRERDGTVPGSHFVARNVFEWRCDPTSGWSDPAIVAEPGRRLIVMCNEGYQSSLAAATLQRFGFEDATDLVDGFQGWRAAGLPVER